MWMPVDAERNCYRRVSCDSYHSNTMNAVDVVLLFESAMFIDVNYSYRMLLFVLTLMNQKKKLSPGDLETFFHWKSIV